MAATILFGSAVLAIANSLIKNPDPPRNRPHTRDHRPYEQTNTHRRHRSSSCPPPSHERHSRPRRHYNHDHSNDDVLFLLPDGLLNNNRIVHDDAYNFYIEEEFFASPIPQGRRTDRHETQHLRGSEYIIFLDGTNQGHPTPYHPPTQPRPHHHHHLPSPTTQKNPPPPIPPKVPLPATPNTNLQPPPPKKVHFADPHSRHSPRPQKTHIPQHHNLKAQPSSQHQTNPHPPHSPSQHRNPPKEEDESTILTQFAEMDRLDNLVSAATPSDLEQQNLRIRQGRIRRGLPVDGNVMDSGEQWMSGGLD